MTPEEKARVKIDQMFNDAGWKVVDRGLKSNKVPSDSNVVISTIQRLFPLLTGKEITDDDDITLTTLMQTIQQKSDNISKAVSQLQELLKGIEE